MKSPSLFSSEAKLRLEREIAQEMSLLHENEIVHKNLRPENILINSDKSIKINDFSFIKYEGDDVFKFLAP